MIEHQIISTGDYAPSTIVEAIKMFIMNGGGSIQIQSYKYIDIVNRIQDLIENDQYDEAKAMIALLELQTGTTPDTVSARAQIEHIDFLADEIDEQDNIEKIIEEHVEKVQHGAKWQIQKYVADGDYNMASRKQDWLKGALYSAGQILYAIAKKTLLDMDQKSN